MTKKILFLFSFVFLFNPVLTQAYDAYVDKNNTNGTEDGTENFPFDTIGEAIDLISKNVESSRKIWVAKGEYLEQVELIDGVELFGVGNDKTIILGRDSSDKNLNWTIKMRNNSSLKNLGIRYGKQGVLVTSGASVKIDNCRIYESEENGIYVEKAKSKKEKFVLKDSKVYDSEKRGMYVYKKKIEIEDNEIYDNEEEGIDLRVGVNGKIEGNEIYDNNESGIEMELKNSDLKIKKNKIYSNSTNGINFQYRGKSKGGKVKMESNKVYKNKNYGLRCSNPAGGKPTDTYFSAAISFSKDSNKNNKLANESSYCNF